MKEKCGRVDVVFANAGGGAFAPLGSITETAEKSKEFRAGMASQVPLGRMGRPDEIATVAVFLASDDASFVAGVEMFVDGGMARVSARG